MPAQLKEILKQTNPYYQQGAPLLLEAHALYEDTTTGKLVAQLKWRNLSHQTVQAVNVILHCKDSFGAALETTHYQYVDVSVAPQAIFGTQNPIELVNALTRQCSVSITGVSFGDGSIWTATGDDACEALPAGKAQTLSGDMLFQFERDLNSEHIDAASQYTPQTYADLWQCGCGNWQKQAEEACIKCKATMAKLAELSEPAALAEHLTAYQQAEEQKRIARAKAAAEKKAKEEADRLACEKQAELNRQAAAQAAAKTKKRSIIIACVLAVAVVAVLIYTQVIQPKQKYDAASALLANGQYDEAFAAFSEIESYGDVKAIIQQVIQPKQKYDAASALLAN
ncbi:MAG: hypothetical protein RSE23_14445, partial [Clostridia bacterium]